MCFMQTESVLQTKNRSRPAKNRFSVALTLREPAILDGLTWWNKPEQSEETSNLAWSYMVEQTRALWGNQQPSMVLHGGTKQSTLRKPATLHGLTWWNKPEHSEGTSSLPWSYMVEQNRALWGNQQPCMVLHGGTNQSTLRKPATLHGLTWWNKPEHFEETSKLAWFTWWKKPEHSEETSNLAWSCMVEQTRALWGNQQHSEETSNLAWFTWWEKPEHSEETSNLAWSYMVEQTRALWRNQQPCMVLHGRTNQSTLRKPAALWGNQQPGMVLHDGTN